MIRFGKEWDVGLFRTLWAEYLLDQEEKGGSIKPTQRTLDYFASLFLAYIRREVDGVTLFGDENSVLLWGEASPAGMPFDTKWGRVAQGWGTYVRPSHRRQGWSRRLRQAAFPILQAQGFDVVFGSATTENVEGFESGTKFGFEIIEVVGVLRLKGD